MSPSDPSKPVSGARAPWVSSSRSSSSRGVGQCCGVGESDTPDSLPHRVGGMPAPVVIAEIVRSGFVEGHHYGSVVALEADGSVAWSVGDVESPILPRSCNKPLQAVGMLRAGLDLDGELLALASASHSGEPFHLEGVRRILEGAGLTEADLQTPLGYPLDDEARETHIRAGGAQTSIAMNCSGKHAAMLATCVANGWDTATYREPGPPAAEGDWRRVRRPHRRAGRGRRGRRLRGAAALRLADRAGACVPDAVPGHLGPGATGRRGDPGLPASGPPAPGATSGTCSGRSPARSARPGRSPATPSASPTGGRWR